MHIEIIKMVAIGLMMVILGVIVIGMSLYMFFGFAGWLLTDPFNWIPYGSLDINRDTTDIQICRDSGGIPILSAWSGGLKRCDAKP